MLLLRRPYMFFPQKILKIKKDILNYPLGDEPFNDTQLDPASPKRALSLCMDCRAWLASASFSCS